TRIDHAGYFSEGAFSIALASTVSSPPDVLVRSGKATLTFEGKAPLDANDAGFQLSARDGQFSSSRNGRTLPLQVRPDARVPPGVVWKIIVNIPDLPVTARFPAPFSETKVVQDGKTRRKLEWRLQRSAAVPPAIKVDVRIGETLRRALIAKSNNLTPLHY